MLKLLFVLCPLLVAVFAFSLHAALRSLVLLSSLVTARSAVGVSVSVSVAVLLPGVGSVTPAGGATVTVIVRDPIAAATIVPLSVMLTLCPLARLSPLHTLVAAS